MTEFNWCHGPKCHERHTTARIRGVKGNKVLRTRKVTKASWQTHDFGTRYWDYFCDDTCMRDYLQEYVREITALHPCTEARETPVEVTKTVKTYDYGYGERTYTDTKITERGVDI